MKINKKVYYKISFELESPLAIGSGENTSTDKDIIKNGRGLPYIPAGAVAGVCRSQLKHNISREDEKKYFGDVERATDKNQNSESLSSKIIFYDAQIEEKNTYHITSRDLVALDEYKTAIDGAKFDMEVLEPGVKFITYIEQNISDGDKNLAEDIVQVWLNNAISFGGKTMRGYGKIGNVSVLEKEFCLDKEMDITSWLDFDMYDDKSWEDGKQAKKKEINADTFLLKLELLQRGGISIRKYTTRVGDNDKAEPDSEQLTVLINDREMPTIPGTSWAGAFKHRMEAFEADIIKEKLFGYVDTKNGNGEKKKSRIRFSETVITGATSKVLTRNAIDRFSGGTSGTALFTERTYYKGETQLEIAIKKEAITTASKKALAAAIADLDNGFLAVGGLTAIGRGMFKVKTINGEEVKDNAYDIVTTILEEVK